MSTRLKLLPPAFVIGAALAGADADAKGRAVIVVFAIEDTRPPKTRLPPKELTNLTAYLSAQLAVGSRFKVVPPEEVKAALSAKKQASYNACFDEACQIEIGKELAAEKSVATKILEVGSQCILTSTLYDLRESASEQAATSRGACAVGALTDAVEKIAVQLKSHDEDKTKASAEGEQKPQAEAQAKIEAERIARAQNLASAWQLVKTDASSRSTPAAQRIEHVRRFLAENGPDNPHRGEADALIASLVREEGGCADGSREGFADVSRHRDIAGCSGGWTIPGVLEVRPPTCDRAAGNGGSNPLGSGCNVSDLCSAGWHVCRDPAEVSSKNTAGCGGAAYGANPQLFFVQRRTGGGWGRCDAGGANDLFGCGNFGADMIEGSGCGPLDKFSNDLCIGLPGGVWSCGSDGEREANAVVKRSAEQGGVLCCRD